MWSVSALPIVMIPAAALLSLTFNSRLMPLLLHIRETLMAKEPNPKAIALAKRNFYHRVLWLRVSILLEYLAILGFTVAAILFMLMEFDENLMGVILGFMLGGCGCIFLGVVCAIIEVVNATRGIHLEAIRKRR